MPYWWLRFDYTLAMLGRREVSIDLPNERQLLLRGDMPPALLRRAKRTLREIESEECERIVSHIEEEAGVAPSDVVAKYPFAKLMTWDDARTLTQLGMTVGSHSVTHSNFTKLSADEQRKELEWSRRDIVRAGIDCRHFCYPYGEYDNISRELVRSTGYSTAVGTTTPGWNRVGDDAFTLRRFSMPKENYELGYVLSGWHDRLHRIRRTEF